MLNSHNQEPNLSKAKVPKIKNKEMEKITIFRSTLNPCSFLVEILRKIAKAFRIMITMMSFKGDKKENLFLRKQLRSRKRKNFSHRKVLCLRIRSNLLKTHKKCVKTHSYLTDRSLLMQLRNGLFQVT